MEGGAGRAGHDGEGGGAGGRVFQPEIGLGTDAGGIVEEEPPVIGGGECRRVVELEPDQRVLEDRGAEAELVISGAVGAYALVADDDVVVEDGLVGRGGGGDGQGEKGCGKKGTGHVNLQ